MKGTASIEAAQLYRGILEYYTGLNQESLTPTQSFTREKFLQQGVILCDDVLDKDVLKLQRQYVSAEGNIDAQRLIIEQTITILGVSPSLV